MPDAPPGLSRRASRSLTNDELGALAAWRERFRAGLVDRVTRAEALLEPATVDAARARLEAMRPEIERYVADSTMQPPDPRWSVESGVAAYIRGREFWLGVERRNLAAFDAAAAQYSRDPLALWASFAVGGHRGRGGHGGRALPRDVALAAFRRAFDAGALDSVAAARDERVLGAVVGPIEARDRLRAAVRMAIPAIERMVRAALAVARGCRTRNAARLAVVDAAQAARITLTPAAGGCEMVWRAARELAPTTRLDLPHALEPRDQLQGPAGAMLLRWENRVFWQLQARWFLPTASARFDRPDRSERHPKARRASARDAAIVVLAEVADLDAGSVRAFLERD